MTRAPTIDEALGIRVSVSRRRVFTADASKLPGTPPVGRGTTELEARYDLLAKLMWNFALRPLEQSYLLTVGQLLNGAHEEATRLGRPG